VSSAKFKRYTNALNKILFFFLFMDYRIVALGLTFALGVIDFLSEGHFMRTKGVFKQRLVSFAAGISVAYLFLHLFPQLYSSIIGADQSYQQLTFFLMMAGFISYHIIEKWIYQHARRDEIVKEVEIEHSLTLFFYHFIIGFVFVSLLHDGLENGLLYFIPLSLHIIINALPHSHRFRGNGVRLFFTSAPLLGAVVGSFFILPTLVQTTLLGLIAGILLFIEAREIVPKRRGESIAFFMVGVALFTVVIFTVRMYVGA